MIVSQFLSWFDSAPPDRRAEAAHALARAYLYSDVSDEARRDMEAAMTILLEDPSPDVRFALADALAVQERAPRHIILALAADHADIATIVLNGSPVFIDLELVDIVASADIVRQLAIARRSPLGSTVAAAIAEIGPSEACEALLDNGDATIAALSLRRIAERYGDCASLRDRLFARADLPADIRQTLVRRLGDLLGELVIGKSWLGEARARAVTREACERATVRIAANAATDDLPALVEHLRLTGQLNTVLLLRALSAGQIGFFERALASLARLPVERVAVHMRGGRSAALTGLYRKAGLPESAFAAFSAALDVLFSEEGDGPTAQKVLSRYQAICDGEPDALVAMLRRFAADQSRDIARSIAERARHAA